MTARVITIDQICGRLDALGLDTTVGHDEGGWVSSGDLVVYWDTDGRTAGWTYRYGNDGRGESGPVDDLDELESVVEEWREAAS